MNKIKASYSVGNFLIILLVIVLSSCSSDSLEEEEEKGTTNDVENSIMVDDNSYELSKSFVYFGSDPEEGNETALYYHEIVLGSSDVYLDEANQTFKASEDSHATVMTVTSSSPSSIKEGTYTVSTWSDGEEYRMVWSYLSKSGTELDMEGAVKISQEGDEISLDFNGLTGENGEEISGSYTGEFEQFDFYLN